MVLTCILMTDATSSVQLANVLSTEALFYACILPFIAFFGSFAFVMYPLRDVLHPTSKSLYQVFLAVDCQACVSAGVAVGIYSNSPGVGAVVADFCEKLLTNWGVRFAGPIAILRNWTFCLFYVMAELWGSVVVSLLFWGFANQVSACQSCYNLVQLVSFELGSSACQVNKKGSVHALLCVLNFV